MLRASFLLLVFAMAFGAPRRGASNAPAQNAPIWSKKGVTFPINCLLVESCQTLRIPSPDAKNTIQVTYQKSTDYSAGYPIEVETPSLQVAGPGTHATSAPILVGVDDEIAWSPDSKCFFINSNYNGYADEIVAVHCVNQPNLGPSHVTQQVEQDMARSFPPCKAVFISRDQCTQMVADPGSYLGVVGLDWIHGSSEMVVMAEVPCDSLYGGIMCQVLGYEIAVPSGKILRRMEPKEFAKEWQHSMAWKFRVPDPPEYKPK
jgi:hypothetical protein